MLLVDGNGKCNGILSQFPVNGTLKIIQHRIPHFTIAVYDWRGWRTVIRTIKVDSKAVKHLLQCTVNEMYIQNLILSVLQSDGSAICTELQIEIERLMILQ
jgi:predicted class III extradiol MEMO1 family dioxygenase